VTFCPHCEDWPIQARDRFCGGCGAFVAPIRFDFTLRDGTEGRRQSNALRLAATSLRHLGPQDREGYDAVGLVVLKVGADGTESPADPRAPPLTLHSLLDGDQPLLGPTEMYRSAKPHTLVLRAVRGRAADQDPRLSPNALAAWVDSEPAPRVKLAQPSVPAMSVRRTETPGAVAAVRMVNGGGPFVLTSARLRVDRTAGNVDPAPDLDPPRLVLAGEAFEAPCWLTPEEADAIEGRKGTRRATVELASGQDVLKVGAVTIVGEGPASATVETRTSAMGLSGRRARLPVRITNTGGQGLTLEGFTFEAKAGGQVHTAELPPPIGCETAIPAGEGRVSLELRPALIGKLAAETRKADFEAAVVAHLRTDAGEPLEQRSGPLALTVRPAETPYAGRVGVDFGTTESAAAVSAAPLPDMGDGLPNAPQVVELGRVGFPARGGTDGAWFLRTRVVRTAEGEYLVGEAALERLAEPRPGDRTIDNFKWKLRDGEGFAAAVAFLRHVRALIEEHPDVAGTIGDDTPVFATRPAKFSGGQETQLIQAFQDAGFPNPASSRFAHGGQPLNSLIKESWSPLPYALFGDPTLFEPIDADTGQSGARRGAVVLSPKTGETGYVIVCDVGGGSADFSVLTLEDDGGELIVRDACPDTDEEFVGVQFERLIEKELLRHLEAQGGRLASTPEGETALAEAVRAIQHRPGLFAPFEDAVRVYFRGVLEKGPGKGSSPDPGLFGSFEQVETLLPLRLPLAGGEEAVLDRHNLPALLAQITGVFADTYAKSIAGITSNLESHAGLPKSVRLTRLILSGRGGRFVLADALISAAFEKTQPITIRLLPQPAKAITSWGGLYLADCAAMQGDIKFDLGEQQKSYFAVTRARMADGGAAERVPFQVHGGWAVLPASDLPVAARRRDKVPIETARAGDDLYDRIDPALAIPPGVAEEPEAYWIVAPIEADPPRPRFVKAASLDEAIATPEADG
jgi:hypothetical protein